MEDSLLKVVQAVEVSRGAVRLINQNYAIVVGLNTLARRSPCQAAWSVQ